MPDVCLYRANRTIFAGIHRSSESLRQTRDFDGVSQFRGRAMSFNVRNGLRSEPCGGMSQGNDLRLAFHSRSYEASALRPIVVNRSPLNDGIDFIAVMNSVGQALQYNHPHAITKGCAGSAGIKSSCASIRRGDAAFLMEIPPLLRDFDGHASRKCHITLICEECLAC